MKPQFEHQKPPFISAAGLYLTRSGELAYVEAVRLVTSVGYISQSGKQKMYLWSSISGKIGFLNDPNDLVRRL